MSQEAKMLQSQVLYGSSQCSCSSCESMFCFTKRNKQPNKCNCTTCQDLNTCYFIAKNKTADCYENINGPTQNPCHLNKDSINKTRTPKAKADKHIVSIKLFKKNVTMQDKPQSCEKLIKNRSENITNNTAVTNYSPISYVVNKVLTTYNEISIKDIIEKVKEVYKACSCKVCECVPNDIDICKCKPCECIECRSYLKYNDEQKPSNDSNCKYYNELKQPSSAYNSTVMKESLKVHNSICNCMPCDCELCKKYSLKVKDTVQCLVRNPEVNEMTSHKTKSNKSVSSKKTKSIKSVSNKCSCGPCQCVVCSSNLNPSNKVVGSVTHLQSNECMCTPCNCADYPTAVPSTSPPLMRDTSTDMAETTSCACDLCLSHSCRQKGDTCGCESRNSVTSKRFEKDTKDVDIHRAIITTIKSESDVIEHTFTVSILTKVIKDFKEGEARQAQKSKSEETKTKSKFSKYNSKFRCCSALCEKSNLSTQEEKSEVIKCQCSPCGCEICEKLKSVDTGVWKSVKFRSKCYCDICRCIYCGGLLEPQNEADNNDQDKPHSSSGTKSGNISTFTSQQSFYPALVHDYINPRHINENVSTYNSNHFRNDNLFKYTCEDCIRKVNGDKNKIKQVRSELSDSFCSCDIVNSSQDPSHSFRSAEMLNYIDNKHSKSDNRLVNNIVNEIMQIEEIKSCVKHENQKELSNSTDSTSCSFQEVVSKKSPYSLKNNMSGPNPIQKQETEFSGSFTLNSFSTNTDNKEGMQIIRECFAKTNIAVINNIDDNKEDNKDVVLEDFDNYTLDDSQDSKDGDEFDYFEEGSILFKAKLLTSELLKMLYEFQKANENFDTYKNKCNTDCDSSEEKRNNLRFTQLGNMQCQDLLQVLSLESQWNVDGDTKVKESSTNLIEENVPRTNFKYSWSKTVLVNKRKTKIVPCYSKTDNDLHDEVNYSESIYTEKVTGNLNYLTQDEDLPKFIQSSIFDDESSENMQDYNLTINSAKYFDEIHYRDILTANKICDDNRHILIENILQNS